MRSTWVRCYVRTARPTFARSINTPEGVKIYKYRANSIHDKDLVQMSQRGVRVSCDFGCSHVPQPQGKRKSKWEQRHNTKPKWAADYDAELTMSIPGALSPMTPHSRPA